jgi:hypothetical protein
MRWRGFTVGILQWFVRSRWRRRTLYVLAGLIALVVLFYAEEDFRGKQAWENYRREWEAKGERFDLAGFIPAPIPDESNFARAPIVMSAYPTNSQFLEAYPGWPRNTNAVNRLDFKEYATRRTGNWYNYNSDGIAFQFLAGNYWPSNGVWRLAIKTDLREWQSYYREPYRYEKEKHEAAVSEMKKRVRPHGRGNVADTPYNQTRQQYAEKYTQYNEAAGPEGPPPFPIAPQRQSPGADVLLALSKYDSALEELREASRLPGAHFPREQNSMASMVPPEIQQVGELLGLRQCAELSLGEDAEALEDAMLMFRLARLLCDNGYPPGRIGMRIVGQEIQPIWEGLADHRWTDSDLKTLEEGLAQSDFFADFVEETKWRRAELIYHVEQLRIHGFPDYEQHADGEYDHEYNLQDELVLFAYRHCPTGWYYQSELSGARAYTENIRPIFDLESRCLSKKTAKELRFQLPDFRPEIWDVGGIRTTVYSMFSAPFAAPTYLGRYLYSQATVDLARVACALERFRLKEGTYPETLDVLAPEFIEKLPIDVVTGEPLHYKRDAEDHFILYETGSAGMDLKGRTRLSPYGYLTGNWVWQYP